MIADLDDFLCEPNQLGRLRIYPDLQRQAELGLMLGLMGFTPIHVQPSITGDWLDVIGLSPLFVGVNKGDEIPVYDLSIVRHPDDGMDDGMIDAAINCPAPYAIELHLPERED